LKGSHYIILQSLVEKILMFQMNFLSQKALWPNKAPQPTLKSGPAVLGTETAFRLCANAPAFTLLTGATWLPGGDQVTFTVTNQIRASHTFQCIT
jgi:hypothetical protein